METSQKTSELLFFKTKNLTKRGKSKYSKANRISWQSRDDWLTMLKRRSFSYD